MDRRKVAKNLKGNPRLMQEFKELYIATGGHVRADSESKVQAFMTAYGLSDWCMRMLKKEHERTHPMDGLRTTANKALHVQSRFRCEYCDKGFQLERRYNSHINRFCRSSKHPNSAMQLRERIKVINRALDGLDEKKSVHNRILQTTRPEQPEHKDAVRAMNDLFTEMRTLKAEKEDLLERLTPTDAAPSEEADSDGDGDAVMSNAGGGGGGGGGSS